MTPPADPLDLARSLGGLIEELAPETERLATTPPRIVEALRQSGLFDLLLPPELGGPGAHITTAVEVIEELSRSDASTGWSYMANIMSGATFAGFLGDSAVQQIFCSDVPAITAGMLGPAGKAERVDGGYVVSGKYAFGSGSGYANWIGAGAACTIDGEPRPIVCAVPRAAVELLGNWDVLGLAGTGSYDYRLPEQFVADEFTYQRVGAQARRGQASLRLGGIPMAVAGHLGVALGTAKRALEELVKVVVDAGKERAGMPPIREQQLFLHDFAKTEAVYRASRAFALDVLHDGVSAVETQGEASELQIQRIRQACTIGVMSAADVVRTCYTWSGSIGLRNPHPLGRCMRDMLAQTQHALVDVNSLTAAGPELLGAYRRD